MVKKLIKAVFFRFGFQLRRLPSEEPIAAPVATYAQRTRWLQALRIKTVLDIGANTGQFAQNIRRVIPDAMIHSFEPLPECFAQLAKILADATNFSAYNIALGDGSGALSFERNEYSQSSSFLKMAPLHQEAFPHTRSTAPVTVNLRRLDDLSAELAIKEPLLVKIDVQGYEDRVLRGGQATIRRATVIIVETSFQILYEGQPLFDEIYRLLTSWGFVYEGALDQLCSPQDGRPLQEDSIFVRR